MVQRIQNKKPEFINLCLSCMHGKDGLPNDCQASDMLNHLPPGVSKESLKCQECNDYLACN